MRELFEFAQIMTQVTPDQRRVVMRRYLFWMIRASWAQGWYHLGSLLLAFSALAAYQAYKSGEPTAVTYALSAIGAMAGAWISIIGYRRERAWRQANPFQIRGDDAQVR